MDTGDSWCPSWPGRDPVGAQAGDSTVGAGALDQSAVGTAISQSTISCAAGRCCGSLLRAASTTGRSASGTAAILGQACRIRYTTAAVGPVPNGGCPLAAYATVSAQAKISAAGPACPSTCSGAMKPVEPIVAPVRVSETESSTWAIPKSMTFGPSVVMITFDGLRSRCTTPAAWITLSASASPIARSYSIPASSGPASSTCSASVGPAAYSVTRNGPHVSVPAWITRTIRAPRTRASTATSRSNRARNSRSPASSGRMTFTATRRPSSPTPR